MAAIRPFKGIRPASAFVEKVAFNPNNLMNENERKEAAQKNSLSFAHVVKPRIDFPDSISKTDPVLFAHAKNYFDKLIKDKILLQDEEEYFYVYRQMLNGRSQTGVIACYHVKEYEEGRIKKHEYTREEKEKENVDGLLVTGMSSNPIFLAYNPVSEIDTLVNQVTGTEPDVHFKSDQSVYHTLWVVKNKELVEKLLLMFNNHVKEVYIADGHHRAASAAIVARKLKEANPSHTGTELYNYLLTCLFPANQLKIYDYNRVVKDLNGHTKENLLKEIEKKFTVEKVSEEKYAPKTLHEIGMYLGNNWYALRPLENTFSNDPVGILDVTILQNNLLNPILGIQDPRTDKRIDFVSGVKGLSSLEKKVNKGKAEIAFALYPVSMQQLFAVSDVGEIMPPKSTWFEPKLLSGLVIYKFK